MTPEQQILVILLLAPFWLPAVALALMLIAVVLAGTSLALMRASIVMWIALLGARR